MKTTIRTIIAFTQNHKKNEVPLENGLNIITGLSQTGKSALLEIVDYCLASSRCNIPVGTIINSSILYCIILEIKNRYIILARRPYNYHDKKERGRTKMFIKVESSKNFFIETLDYNYFIKHKDEFQSIDAVKLDIERYLNFSVSKKIIRKQDNEIEKEKPSMRNMTSFLFQHQNLIANKFALFYRFDDFNKRNKTITELPILLGLVDQEYYNNHLETERITKLVKKLEKEIVAEKLTIKELKETIKDELKEYYCLINRELSFEEFNNHINNCEELPTLKDEDTSEKSYDYIKQLDLELDSLSTSFDKVSLQIYNIEKSLIQGDKAEKNFTDVKTKLPADDIQIKINICPFCSNKLSNLNSKLSRIKKAEKIINENLSFISTERDIYFKEELEVLKNKRKDIKNQINYIAKQKRNIKESNKKIGNRLDFIKILAAKKAKIEYALNKASGKDLTELTGELESLYEDLEYYKAELAKYNINKKLSDFESDIQSFMNKVIKQLDFEYKPVNVKFETKTFNLYQEEKKNKIFISNMGSGSNWLSCHLGLFLSFQNYIARKEDECSIPTFLFLDQPSQVYFPDKKGDNIDYNRVENIYNTINWAINEIKKNTGHTIQIIVTDHADGLKLVKNNFEDNVVKRWKTTGDGFIEKENIVK